jgi:hypothetical protein
MYGGNGWLAATAGTLASISDGPAANSGDAACTTFGTTVTGGGGALKLLLWRNGTAWTLRGLLTNSNRKAARSHPLALRKPCAQLLVFRWLAGLCKGTKTSALMGFLPSLLHVQHVFYEQLVLQAPDNRQPVKNQTRLNCAKENSRLFITRSKSHYRRLFRDASGLSPMLGLIQGLGT